MAQTSSGATAPNVALGRFMMSLQSLLCRFIGHKRSDEAVEYHRRLRRYVSVCERCGLPLIRRKGGRWEETDSWRA